MSVVPNVFSFLSAKDRCSYRMSPAPHGFVRKAAMSVPHIGSTVSGRGWLLLEAAKRKLQVFFWSSDATCSAHVVLSGRIGPFLCTLLQWVRMVHSWTSVD